MLNLIPTDKEAVFSTKFYLPPTMYITLITSAMDYSSSSIRL